MTPSKRIAVNSVVKANSTVLSPAVIEFEGDAVVNVYPLERELPFTEWLGGTVTLQEEADGRLTAYKDGEKIEEP